MAQVWCKALHSTGRADRYPPPPEAGVGCGEDGGCGDDKALGTLWPTIRVIIMEQGKLFIFVTALCCTVL